MPNEEKKPIKAPYMGNLLTPGTVPLTESEKVAANLAKEKNQNKVWKQIPENANAEGINKFQDYLKSKGLVGLKELQSDEGYNRLIKPEIANFNKANPNLAITPEHIATLQNYHKSIDPRIIVDSRYGPETTQLRYPDPTMASITPVQNYTAGAKAGFPQNSGINTITLPDTENGGGFNKGKTYSFDNATGKILDDANHKFEGQYYNGKRQNQTELAYLKNPNGTDMTYNDLVKSGKNMSYTNNGATTNITGNPNTADIVTKNPIQYNISAQAGGQGNTNINKNLQGSTGINTPPPANFNALQNKAKGGLISKVRGYYDGGTTGNIQYDSTGKPINTLPTNNPGIQTKGQGLNFDTVSNSIGNSVNGTQQGASIGSGLGKNGSLIGAGIGLVGDLAPKLIDSGTQDIYGRINTGSKTGDFTAGISSGAIKSGMKGAQMGSNFGPAGLAVGSGLGVLYGGIKGGIKAQDDRDSIQREKDAKDMADLADQNKIATYRRDYKYNQEMQKRMAGMKKGGLVRKFADGGLFDPFNGNIPQGQMGFNTQLDVPTQHKFEYGKGTGILNTLPMFSNGGKIVGKGTGTSDSIKARIKDGNFVVPKVNAEDAKVLKKYLIAPSVKKKANLNQEGGEPVKVSNGEFLLDEDDVSIFKSKGVNMNKLAPNADDKMGYDNGGKIKKLSYQEYLALPLADKKIYDAARVKYGFISDASPQKRGLAAKVGNGLSVEDMKKLSPSMNEPQGNVVPQYNQDGSVIVPTTNENSATFDNVNNLGKNSGSPTNNGRKLSFNKITGLLGEGENLLYNYANNKIPNQQINQGLEMLRNSGKRPVDVVDQGFQDTVNKANANAQSGFSPEEQAMINAQNLEQLKADKNAARDLSGGSAGNAYVGERQASNDYYNNGLVALVAGKKLKGQNQKYADELNMAKADKMRQLHDDRMQAWQQNQTAGGNLLNAGRTNLTESNRYNAELNAMKQAGNFENDWMKNI